LRRDVHRHGTIVLSAALMLVGVAIIARTVGAGGSPVSVGILLGILFVVAGAGRLWIATRGDRG
jgi:hypothetical protein